jgi:hypothetical protein
MLSLIQLVEIWHYMSIFELKISYLFILKDKFLIPKLFEKKMIKMIRLSSNKLNGKIKHTSCNFSIYYKRVEV